MPAFRHGHGVGVAPPPARYSSAIRRPTFRGRRQFIQDPTVQSDSSSLDDVQDATCYLPRQSSLSMRASLAQLVDIRNEPVSSFIARAGTPTPNFVRTRARKVNLAIYIILDGRWSVGRIARDTQNMAALQGKSSLGSRRPISNIHSCVHIGDLIPPPKSLRLANLARCL